MPPAESPVFWVVAVIAAILVGISKGGWAAVGTLGVPVLSLVMNPLVAAGLLLPVYIVSDWFGLYAYRHSFDGRVVAIMIPAGLIGVVLGYLSIPYIDLHVPGGERIITGLIGAIGLVFSAYMIFRHDPNGPAVQPKIAPGLFWGALAGFTSYVSHSGAPPYQTYVQPLRLDRLAYAGTATIIFAFINATKLPFYWATGQVNLDSLWMAGLIAVPAVGGVFLGKRMVGWVSQATFYNVTTWALLLVSVKLLWDAVSGG
jgi:uncharacterized membrane protein YfcA